MSKRKRMKDEGRNLRIKGEMEEEKDMTAEEKGEGMEEWNRGKEGKTERE